jgi:hypothetical protein
MNVRFEPLFADEHQIYDVYDRRENYAGTLVFRSDNTLFVGYCFKPIDIDEITPETLAQILAGLDKLNGGKR